MMTVNPLSYEGVSTPIYIVEESLLRKNLQLIATVAQRAGIEIILAFKAFALWKTFPIFREYINSTTASSLSEARLAFEEFGAKAHTYSPAYTESEIETIARCSSHITFNSLSQYRAYYNKVKSIDAAISCGLRVNPEYSEVGTLLYNPCAPGTRFGVTSDELEKATLAETADGGGGQAVGQLPEGIDGFHCHCHCESGADVFERTLKVIEERFGKWLPQLKWINFGGGHLMTRKDYDVELLVGLMQDFRRRHPNLKVILEPGSAFAWQTGPLVASVVDLVENHGIKTAILDVSFTCHMPDCLEMPYHPTVRGAELVDIDEATKPCTYRLGGNSCLSGDVMGSWRFPEPLKVGDKIIFEDMIHYTTVKTNTFNGITHPSIGILRTDNQLEILRVFGYEDYKNRQN